MAQVATAKGSKISEICRKPMELLGFPKGLRLFDDIQECEYDDKTGFVRMKRDKKVVHEFNINMIRVQVQYDTKIIGKVDKLKMKEVSGVKIKEVSEVNIKELLEPQKMKKVNGEIKEITISEISIDDPSSAGIKKTFAPQIYFESAGIKKSYPVGAFEIEKSLKAQIKH